MIRDIKKVWIIFGIFVLFFSACGDSDDLKVSSGNKTDSQTLKQIEEMDKQSYAGLEDIFQDTKNLNSNGKTMLIVFGKENCVYCEKLKADLKNFDDLRHILKNDFSSYYVNIDFSKIHNFSKKDEQIWLDTIELARQFRVNATPALAFLDANGEPFFTYPGYVKPQALKEILIKLKDIELAGIDRKELNAELVGIINQNF